MKFIFLLFLALINVQKQDQLMDYFGENLDQQEGCVVCLYVFQKMQKLFDVASECPDSIDFDRDKNSHIWTPNPHLLQKLNSKLLFKLNQEKENIKDPKKFYIARMIPRIPKKKDDEPLEPVYQQPIPIGKYQKINEQPTEEQLALKIKNFQNSTHSLDYNGQIAQNFLKEFTKNYTNFMKNASKDSLEEFYLFTLSKLTREQYPNITTDKFMKRYFENVLGSNKINELKQLYNLMGQNSSSMSDLKQQFYDQGLQNYWESIKDKSPQEAQQWLEKYFPSFNRGRFRQLYDYAKSFRFKQISNLISYETNSANYNKAQTYQTEIGKVIDNRGQNNQTEVNKYNFKPDDQNQNKNETNNNNTNQNNDNSTQNDDNKNKTKNDNDTANNLITYLDIRHPRTVRIIDRNRGTVNTQTDLGNVEKNIFQPPANPKQKYDVEHKLDEVFRESDHHEHYDSNPNQEGYDREFGSLENQIKQYLEPGPMGYKKQNNGRTDYHFDTSIRKTTKQKVVKTNSQDGLRVNNMHYPYGMTSHLRFKQNEQFTLTEQLQSQPIDKIKGLHLYIKEFFEKKEKKRIRFSDNQISCAFKKMKQLLRQFCYKDISHSFRPYCNIFYKQEKTIVESLLYFDDPKQICQNLYICQKS